MAVNRVVVIAALVAVALTACVPVFAGPESGQAPTGPRLVYTKTLKGSTPEYEKIVVNYDGSGSYDGRHLMDPPNPRAFHLSSGVTQRLFTLASELHDFQNVSLESHKRVADLGLKTFKYVDGNRAYESQFNYSTDRKAAELTDLFEGLGAVERHIGALDYSMKYDRLGLPRELTLIQIDLDNKSLLDPQLMTGTLESIMQNPAYLHLAQVRAKDILKRIQKGN
ncbi:MAG: hypothetical protein KGM47_14275 [Acidobacteriota bacterium]|nr:hypothetical protein [Acidobacteriota bacterium]